MGRLEKDSFDFKCNKRVTKNDKKSKKSIYSSTHIRLVLKHLEGTINNARESESVDRERVCCPEIRGMAQSQKKYAHGK